MSVRSGPAPRRAFLSTIPAWGATLRISQAQNHRSISIHAPRVGSDRPQGLPAGPLGPFLSTLPAWGATYAWLLLTLTVRFLSTLPAWGATEVLGVLKALK